VTRAGRTGGMDCDMTVLITGGTGNVGGNVVAGLLERGVPVRVTSRDPSQAILPAGVEVARADLTDPDSLRPALAGVDCVFLYPRIDDPDALVTVLSQAGVGHVVLLSTSAAAGDDPDNDAAVVALTTGRLNNAARSSPAPNASPCASRWPPSVPRSGAS
jgi:uncharacterized protein YbjT (DUF2867 family)